MNIPSLFLLIYKLLLSLGSSELFSRDLHVLLDKVLSTRSCDLVALLLLGELALDLCLGCVAPVRRREDAEGNRDAGVKIQDADLRVREPLLEPFELAAERCREMSLLLAVERAFRDEVGAVRFRLLSWGMMGVDKEERNVMERALGWNVWRRNGRHEARRDWVTWFM